MLYLCCRNKPIKNKIMKTIKLEKELKKVHKNGTLKSVYAYLRKHNIQFEVEEKTFGWDSEKNRKAKEDFLKESFCFHKYSILKRNRKNGYGCSILRAVKVHLI